MCCLKHFRFNELFQVGLSQRGEGFVHIASVEGLERDRTEYVPLKVKWQIEEQHNGR